MFIVLAITISLSETSISGISDVEAAQKIKISKKKISNEDIKEAIKLYVVVTHKPIAVSKVTLSKTSLSLYKDDTYTLTAAISSANADNQKIIWKSSNTKVATVTNGVIHAVGAGSARITATVGNISAACNVTVKNAINII